MIVFQSTGLGLITTEVKAMLQVSVVQLSVSPSGGPKACKNEPIDHVIDFMVPNMFLKFRQQFEIIYDLLFFNILFRNRNNVDFIGNHRFA